MAIIQAFTTGLVSFADTENMNLALDIAQARMEQIKNTPFGGLVDSGPIQDVNFSDFQTSVDVDEGLNPLPVRVTVSWDVRGSQTDVTLATQVANY